ncbi:MAG: PD40 domain-containing protein [Spirochaetes bacterium]|nr:PD40 domain-containing protein [Spirochaetota bacterium]
MHDRYIAPVPFLPGIAVALLLSSSLISATGCSDSKDQGDPGPLIALFRCSGSCAAKTVNTEFSNPQKVTINGYAGHAMEPFVTRAGTGYLFFNSLNDGNDTSLYYAVWVDDVTFTSQGKINNVNGSPPHLDAVASMDTSNNFYYISTRNWPIEIRNVYTGTFAAGTVTPNPPLSLDGDFYISDPGGWIIMDCEISPDGNHLYFVNAHFSGGSVPDRSNIGIAEYSAPNTFNKAIGNETVMAAVNTNNCLEYAPCISDNGLELFFTRLDLCTAVSEILVAKRADASDPFGEPARIGAISGFVEAPSLTADGKTLYYHMNDGGVYTIYKVSRP